MNTPLFSKRSLRDELDHRLNSCIKQIDNMTVASLRDPALAGWLIKLWSERTVCVPMLNATQKSGKKREEESVVVDYGRQVRQKTVVVDVSIPFAGDSAAFGYSPSQRPIFQTRIDVRPGALVCTISLNPNEEARLNSTVAQIEQTLDTMRSEVAAFARHANKALADAAARRLQSLEEQERLADMFSFKVE